MNIFRSISNNYIYRLASAVHNVGQMPFLRKPTAVLHICKSVMDSTSQFGRLSVYK